ncbi:hypothetical protein [Legionella sp. CNM-4043-24]|uniref:hypothetical protein n=1 Tax=Legionella sp. CNM-4043-24 TaxID=3421646 RepID=UPI00403A81CE
MNKAFFTGLLAAAVALSLYLYLTWPPAAQPTPQSEIFNSQIAAFDYDGLHKDVTNQRLFNGDAVMFLRFSSDNKVYFFSSLAELQAYDPGHSGFIALNTPGFSDYILGQYFKDSRTIEYQSMQKSGIAGITLTYNDQGQAISGTVILADNSHRNISIVPINDSFLLLATLKSSSEMNIN